MPRGKYTRTEQYKKILKENLGKGFTGYHHTIKARKSIGKASKGKKKPWAGKYDHTNKPGNFGKGHPAYKYWQGKKRLNLVSEKRKKELSERMKGQNNPMYGRSKEQSPAWQGGKSFEPYSTDWTQDLKRAIRKRDKYTCQICRKEPAIYCHHIDYNKKNCNPDNLITLCHSCHTKTNYNRNYWIKYFAKQYQKGR